MSETREREPPSRGSGGALGARALRGSAGFAPSGPASQTLQASAENAAWRLRAKKRQRVTGARGAAHAGTGTTVATPTHERRAPVARRGASRAGREERMLRMLTREYMTPDPFVVHVSDSIGSVLAVMMEADVRHLPVVENGRLLGIVSDRDLRRSLDVIPGPGPGGRLNALERPISDLMSSDVISVNPETEMSEVIDLMLDHRIGAIPVVEGDGLRVVGIISYIDVLRAARPQLS